MRNENPPVLLAEDNEDDIFLIQRAWARCGLPNRLVVTRDGYQAIDYLGGLPPYTDRHRNPLPCLILLDIKMRLLDGFEVLAWLRSRSEFRHLPSVMLSSFCAEKDISRARELGAVEFCLKPQNLTELESILERLHRTWVRDSRNGRRSEGDGMERAPRLEVRELGLQPLVVADHPEGARLC